MKEYINQVLEGDCIEVLRNFPDNCFSAVIADPPYGLDSSQVDIRRVLSGWLAGEDVVANKRDFMGKNWQLPGPKAWEEIMRVLKPGGHILSFYGTRTFDLGVTAMRIAGCEIRDKMAYICEVEEQSLCWSYGSGFPKSLSIGKAMDKSAGRIGQDVTAIKMKLAALFDASGKSRKQIDEECGFRACNYLSFPTEDKKHDPWFYVLPSQEKWEKIKDIVGHGDPEIDSKLDEWFTEAEREIVGRQTKARKTDCGVPMPTTGDTEYQTWDVTAPATDAAKLWEGYGTALKPAHEPIAVVGKDAAPLSAEVPFFYNAKAATKERNLGCKNLFWIGDGDGMRLIDEDEHKRLSEENEKRKGEDGFAAHRLAQGNPHPTVKPIELCRYLVKLVKMPENNLILDPFCGSGSTLIACVLEGCDFVGIDSDPMATTIAATRAHYFRCLGEKGLK